ncbi:MAG: hypothetical protein N2385_07995, partial [Chloroflexus sp.]|nr:hypothetical protein [Chloroflexus sp.]
MARLHNPIALRIALIVPRGNLLSYQSLLLLLPSALSEAYAPAERGIIHCAHQSVIETLNRELSYCSVLRIAVNGELVWR